MSTDVYIVENTDTEFIKLYFDNIKELIKTEKVKAVPAKYEKKKIRMTLDYSEDLEFFRTVVGHFRECSSPMTFDNVLLFLEQNPSVVGINWSREQNWRDNQTNMIKKIKKEGV